MNQENNNSQIGIMGVLLIVFIVLKLVGLISWSWWWVLSPLWISFLVYFLVAVVYYLVASKR